MGEPIQNKKYIDLQKIIAKSNAKILKKLPGFVVILLKKLIRQNEINLFLNKYSENMGVDFLVNMKRELNITIEVDGIENLPENGKCIFAANHPFGVADGLALTYTVSQKYGSLKAIANDAFMFVPQMHPLVAAVNVFGRSSREYIQALDEVYNSESPITHFPAGRVSRKYHGKVQDQEWQKSFITKSVSSQRAIVPFYFHGKNSRLFYFVFSLRQKLGIKLNIELALLPHELFNKRNSTIKISIGKPIPYSTFDKRFSHHEWAQLIRAHVYRLGEKGTNTDFAPEIENAQNVK